MMSCISFFPFTWVFGVLCKKFLPNQGCRDVFLFFSKTFIVLALTLFPMIHFESFTVYNVRKEYYFTYLHVSGSYISQKDVYSPLNCLCTLVENQLFINLRIYFWLSMLLHECIYLLLRYCHNILITL